MLKIRIHRRRNQTISNEDIRLTILQMGQQDGGIKAIAKKSGMSYDALWGQLNRNAGVLAYTIARITRGTRDHDLIQQICRASDGVFVPLDNPDDTKEAIQSIIVNSARDLGLAIHEEKRAGQIDSPGGKKKTRFEIKKIRLKIYKVVTDLLQWERQLEKEGS